MTIAFDAATEAVRTDIEATFDFTHAPVGNARGVVVAIVHGTAASDPDVSQVSYGNTLLTKVADYVDAAGEPGVAELWFCGLIPPEEQTGAQSVSLLFNEPLSDEDLHAVCMTFIAGNDTDLVDSDGRNGDALNPSVTLQYSSRTCIAIGALYAGGNSPASFSPNGNCTTVHDHGFTSYYSEVIRQTTPGSSDFAIGGTASTDDVAFAAIAISERSTGSYKEPMIRRRGRR